MIVSKTPYRISLFGGGTDYPAWFLENGGAVIGGAIDKYCYITVRYLPSWFDYKSRFVTHYIEYVDENSHATNPAIKETLAYFNVERGVEILHRGDLPANRGMGTSSAFTVGLSNAIRELTNYDTYKKHRIEVEHRANRCAEDAIFIEQNLIRENVGCQDQWLCARGGFNHIIWWPGKPYAKILPLPIPDWLSDYLILLDTGTMRRASEIAGEQIKKTPYLYPELTAMRKLVCEAVPMLSQKDWMGIGRLLHEGWMIKRSLTNRITTPLIDDIYNKAISAGAIGGKLLGAGGGGFMLFMVEPEKQGVFKEALSDFKFIPFRFEPAGTRIIFSE